MSKPYRKPSGVCRLHRMLVLFRCPNCGDKGPHFLGTVGLVQFTCEPLAEPETCYYCPPKER